ncbi:MAG: hypothetical protein HY287_12540 [Planctomycetes bacterium]|nr:hypothetical protein [Planctomycetota bacterium]
MFSILLLVSIWSNAHPVTDGHAIHSGKSRHSIPALAAESEPTNPKGCACNRSADQKGCGCANCSGADCTCGCAMEKCEKSRANCPCSNCSGANCDCGCAGKCDGCKRATANGECPCGDNCGCGASCSCAGKHMGHHGE